MHKLLTLALGLLCAMHAAAFNIESGKKYRIVCDEYSYGSLCLGSNHSSQYPLYHPISYDASNASFDDAFWILTVDANGLYTVVNAKTSQYITWTSTKNSGYQPGQNTTHKGLTLSSTDKGEQCHWVFTEYSDGLFQVSTKYSGVDDGYNYWNLRRANSSTPYVLGTYKQEFNANSLFRLVDEEGNISGIDNGGGSGGGETGGGDDKTDAYTVVDGGSEAYVIQQTGRRLTVIPRGYVSNYDYSGNTINFDLINGERLTFEQTVEGNLNRFPADEEYPAFTSYKFNNKFNYQLPLDAEAANPGDADVSLSVGGIGKWLTASFQLSDPDAVAYIGETLQESKVTRQRFDQPMTYTIGFKTWRKVELRDYSAATGKDAGADADIRTAYVPYGRQQTVSVDWLTDHATGEYGVPRIDITLTDHPDASWGSSYSWAGSTEFYWIGQDGKGTYVPASIEIDGASVFPDMEATPILIKGRGNSSWAQQATSKNPYHFKFESKQKPLGLTKGKHWVLLANKQAGSMTTNAIGHRVADMMGGVAPCHIIPVELYINGSYRGSYNLCEKVGFAGNSVDLDDETYAAMLELDTYSDETRYYDNYYSLSTKMKEPDFEEKDDFGNLTYTGPLDAKNDVMADWNDFLSRVKSGDDFTPYVDVERLTAYLAANEYIAQCELKHPKSVFVYSENVTDGFNIETGRDDTPWVFGPLWDCDWDFGYEQQRTYFQVSQTSDFFGSLISGGDSNGRARSMWSALRNNSTVDEAYYYKWHDFYYNKLPELLDFCDEYYAFAQRSLEHDKKNETYNAYSSDNYATTTANAKRWLQQRADYIFGRLNAYPLPTIEPEPDPVYADAEALPTGNLFNKASIGFIVRIIDSLIKGEGTIELLNDAVTRTLNNN